MDVWTVNDVMARKAKFLAWMSCHIFLTMVHNRREQSSAINNNFSVCLTFTCTEGMHLSLTGFKFSLAKLV